MTQNATFPFQVTQVQRFSKRQILWPKGPPSYEETTDHEDAFQSPLAGRVHGSPPSDSTQRLLAHPFLRLNEGVSPTIHTIIPTMDIVLAKPASQKLARP
jgi:hypothetical protein